MARPKAVKEATKKDEVTKTIAKKPRVVKAIVPVPEMVMAIMKTNAEGCTLQTIRNTITKEYGAKMTKKLQTAIKDYLSEEYRQGRMKMLDADGDELKFNKKLFFV